MAEIASAFVSIVPSMRGFGGQLRAGVSGSTSQVGKSAGSAFGKVFAAAAAIGVGAALGGYLKGAIDQASDLSESANKIDAIFGKAGAQVQNFADGGARALGQTKLEVLNAASQFGTFGKAAGLAGGDLAKFSTDFTSLSTDLASFYNTSPEQAVEAIGAALRGEAEPIRQYGVLLDDATLRQEALRLGLVNTTKEALTPQQKVLAAQAAIMKQTADAQGDFGRTSGGLANQQRILSASLSDIKTQIGTALLPVATQFFTFLNDSGIPAMQTAAGAITGFLGPAFDRIGEFFNGSGGQGISSFAATLQANLLPVLQTMANTFQTVVLPAVLTLVDYLRGQLTPVFTQAAGIVTSQVLPILSSLAQFFYGQFYPAVVQVVAAVAVALRPAFEALVQYVTGSILPNIQKLLALFQKYQPTIEKVVLAIVKVTGKVLEFAAKIISFVLPKALKFQAFLTGALISAVSAAIGAVAKIIGWIGSLGSAFVNAVKFVAQFQKGLAQKVGDALSFMSKVPGKIVSALGNLGSLLLSAGGDIMGGLAQGIRNTASKVIGAIKSYVTDKLPGFVKKALGIASPSKVMAAIAKWIPEGIAKGIEDNAKRPVDAMKRMLDAVKKEAGKIGDTVSRLKSDFASLASGVADSFGGDLFQATTATGLTQLASAQSAQLRELRAASRRLGKFNLSPEFLSSLFASGNSSLILDLAGSKVDARQASRSYKETQSLAKSLGRSVGGAVYGDKIDKQTGLLADIRDDIRDLDKRIGGVINGAAAAGKRRARA